ncbi:tRNA pseudouridine synthase B [Desulfocicer vacuolatum DSM 3385]|uniref:tRNA pseudouridine synthase B n=1 Tax=Desulfocicer vacuolatum DSM 3385 TaxID=1121400 RepID=A0A1W1ZW09_9BACT|nr:tRNA pseudouridine(55) synthase TruB [Desulfocicer vacuolatum]SMC52248.1 tRNA pseudouridine synthase B [Desulfocicer vacuolatum DSM 3385]
MTPLTDGIIAVDKPAGISSARVVARLKRRLGVKKVGHTGTLDPFATGVLLCGINKGTRISRFLIGGEKSYVAGVHLGVDTDTLDAEGEITASAGNDFLNDLTEEQVATAVAQFKGPQKQIPPVYSALKHNGVPLYRLARQGTPVEKPPRDIEIYDIHVTSMELPLVEMDVRCSSGTYIRSLARDIGSRLGCGAHLASLCRTACCGISLKETVPLSNLEQMDDSQFNGQIIPMARALSFLPAVSADESMLGKIRFGQPLGALLPPASFWLDAGQNTFLRILDPRGSLAAVVEYDETVQTYNYCCVFVD